MTSLMTSQNHVAFRQVLENSNNNNNNKNKNNKAISKTALKHAVKNSTLSCYDLKHKCSLVKLLIDDSFEMVKANKAIFGMKIRPELPDLTGIYSKLS